MTEPKFTPGPWTAVQHGEGIYTWTIRGNDEMEDRSLAIVGVGTPNLQRDEANMRLIAAAPEMYDFVDLVKHVTDNPGLYAEACALLDRLNEESEVDE